MIFFYLTLTFLNKKNIFFDKNRTIFCINTKLNDKIFFYFSIHHIRLNFLKNKILLAITSNIIKQSLLIQQHEHALDY